MERWFEEGTSESGRPKVIVNDEETFSVATGAGAGWRRVERGRLGCLLRMMVVAEREEGRRKGNE